VLRMEHRRIALDLLRRRELVVHTGQPCATSTAEPGIWLVLGAAARATHPATRVTQLGHTRLIMARLRAAIVPVRGRSGAGRRVEMASGEANRTSEAVWYPRRPGLFVR
jgi:hypothetical protein